MHCDNTEEYVSLRKSFDRMGILMKTSFGYSPQFNGASERMNWSLMDTLQALMRERQLDNRYSDEPYIKLNSCKIEQLYRC